MSNVKWKSQSKHLHLPRLRKILPVNLVSLENSNVFYRTLETSRVNNSLVKVKKSRPAKSSGISPKNDIWGRENERQSQAKAKSSQKFVFMNFSGSEELDKSRGKTVRIPRGFSGNTVSKLYKSRNIIKFKTIEKKL